MKWIKILPLVFFGACVQKSTLPERLPQTFDDVQIADIYPERSPSSNIDDELKMPPDYKPGKLFSVIKEPSILAVLEQNGYSLADHLGHSGKASSNKELLANPLYQSFVSQLKTDLEDVAVDDLKATNPKVTRTNAIKEAAAASHRVFDIRWLSSAIAKYELVGVMNRLDRVSFNPEHCGEMRFVYRLSYDTKKIYSRMPMTLMVKYFVTHDPQKKWQDEAREYAPTRSVDQSIQRWNMCKRLATQWVYPKEVDYSNQPEKLVEWLSSPQGPLASNLIEKRNFKSIELNMQALRIPSGARRDLAGHGVYLMRVFKRAGEALVPEKMENTPDVTKLTQQPELKKQLFQFLQNKVNYHKLDAGILKIPDQFLADKALSYSPFGIGRKDNRMFEQIFTESELQSIYRPDAKYDYIKSPGAVARRLNDMSCVGCHQGRATAGFHFLGIDKPSTHQMNALIFEGSGHFETELKRRAKYLDRVLNNLIPLPSRDFSIAPPKLTEEGTTVVKAGYGHFCGLKGGGFERWQCDAGLTCQQIDEAVGEKELGKCFPAVPQAGDPCFITQVVQSPHQTDKLKVLEERTCGGKAESKNFVCSDLKLGHPAGTCYKPDCKSGADSKLEICGYLAGDGFNKCMIDVFAKKKTFVDCAMEFRQQAVRGLCNESKSCRNDYVCVRAKDHDNGQRNGYCAPSYFLFQVRLDGHPLPE